MLDRIERYYDGVPRAAARVETIGPFTLFVKQGAGWPYYARPNLGATTFSAADVERVRSRQRELGVRLALGATVADIRRLVLGHGLRLCAVGTVLGSFGAIASARLIEHRLFGVTAGDPATQPRLGRKIPEQRHRR